MKTLSAKPARPQRPAPRVLIAPVLGGQVRRFGLFGPAYIIRVVKADTCWIEVPATGEKLTLPLAKVQFDPLDR